MLSVALSTHHGAGTNRLLYEGPASGKEAPHAFIAAAPEMAEALERALFALDTDGPASAAATLNIVARALLARLHGEGSAGA